MKLLSLRFFLCVAVFVTIEKTVAQTSDSNTVATGSTPTTTATPTQAAVSSDGTSASAIPPVTSSSPTLSTPSADEICAENNQSCSTCLGVAGAKCLWCNSDSSCKAYPLSKVLPPKDICALDKARWGVCWLNFEAMIIAVSTIGGIIILTITSCCVYCCCCRGRNKRKYDKEDARYNAQKMERKVRSDERRAEKKERLDEIRRKYGLMKEEPCQRFDV